MENTFELGKLIPLLAPIILVQIALLIAAIVDLIRHPKARYLPRWAWVLVIVFVNIFGPIIYFIFGREQE